MNNVKVPRWKRKVPVIRKLEFYVISAQDLRSVRHTGRMKTYVAAFVQSDKKAFTLTDEEGDRNPAWNQKLCLEVDEQLLEEGSGAQLNFNIYAHSFFKDKLVGGVTIMLPDAVKESGSLFPVTSHLVFTLDGNSQGILNICVPPGGRFPKRLDSLSFKSVPSDRGIHLEAIPSFKGAEEEEEEELEEEGEKDSEGTVKKNDDPISVREETGKMGVRTQEEEDDDDLGIYDESFFDDSIRKNR